MVWNGNLWKNSKNMKNFREKEKLQKSKSLSVLVLFLCSISMSGPPSKPSGLFLVAIEGSMCCLYQFFFLEMKQVDNLFMKYKVYHRQPKRTHIKSNINCNKLSASHWPNLISHTFSGLVFDIICAFSWGRGYCNAYLGVCCFLNF